MKILVLYYSHHGHTKNMAYAIASGIESYSGAQAVIRTVPDVSPETEQTAPSIPAEGDIYATHDDLRDCDGLIIGSPTRFGNMAAPLKHFLDSTSSLWMTGALSGKPAACFTSSASMHGGQETTLLTMMMPLFHHGCLLVGIPSTLPELSSTQSGGTPYGPSHVSGEKGQNKLSPEEHIICNKLGTRVAEISHSLK